jgi:hypothetical protein
LPILRVARPKPPYFPQANISTAIKQICIYLVLIYSGICVQTQPQFSG